MPTYNITQCNRCLHMDFSYFDNEVHRWCKAYDAKIEGMSSLTETNHCDRYYHPKGSKKKSRYLRKEEYLRKYND